MTRTESIFHYPDGGEGNTGTTPDSTDVTLEERYYDGDHVVLDFLQHNWGSFSLEHRYLYGAAVDQVLAQENVSDPSVAGVLWMLADNQGTVRDLVDGSGQFVAHNTYDAFGTPVGSAMINNLTRYFYTGRDYDRATQLQYNRERWYDPATGKFLTEDPIGFAGGDSNLYRYAGNDPTNGTDPSGLEIIYGLPPGPGGTTMLPGGPTGQQPNNGPNLYWYYFMPWNNPSGAGGVACGIAKGGGWVMTIGGTGGLVIYYGGPFITGGGGAAAAGNPYIYRIPQQGLEPGRSGFSHPFQHACGRFCSLS